MGVVGLLVMAIALAYGCAAVAPLVRPPARAAWGLVPVVLACPMLLPSGEVGLRAATAVIAGDLAFKLVDYLRRRGRPGGIARRDYFGALIPLPVFAVIVPDQRRRLASPVDRRPDVARLVVGSAGCVGAILTLRALARTGPIRSSFWLDHAAMLTLFVVAIESLSLALCGLERLAGFDTAPIVRGIYRSRTVAEFWRRYNHRIHAWLYLNIFRPCGGRRRPALATMITFAASGVFHELMFGIATARFTGYQFTFFALQGPAVVASGGIGRLARRGGPIGEVVARGSTILFLALTSVLFFDGVARVFPFIYADPGRTPLP